MNKTIESIIQLLEDVRVSYGIGKEALEKNGAVYYMNGNDGTSFDWEMNDRLCEFGYFLKDDGVWAFKLLLDRGGDATVYCYPNGEMSSVAKITHNISDPEEMEELRELMIDAADDKGLYDRTLDELGLL